MFILDSDHLSLLQHQGTDEYRNLAIRISPYSADQFFVTIVSFHEQVNGWTAFVARAKDSALLVRGYTELEGILSDFARAQVLPFSAAAADIYDQLRKQRIRVDWQDQTIAVAHFRCLAVCRGGRQDGLTSPFAGARLNTFICLNIMTLGKTVSHRATVAKELAGLLRVLAHPQRIRIIEELRGGERDVTSIQAVLKISHSSVSQHLMQLRAHRLVTERREGRQVFYHLRQPDVARWLAEAMRFFELESIEAEQLRKAIKKTRADWASK